MYSDSMQNDTNQNLPAVEHRVKYVAPPFRTMAGPPPQDPANVPQKKGPKVGLIVGVAAVAGFFGGLLWSKVKKNQGEDGEEPEVEAPDGDDDKSD